MAFGIAGAITEAMMYGPEGADHAAMSIAGINPVTHDIMLPERTFQYWPASISDSISIGWNFKDIPGMASELAQWSSNGGRTLSFEVTFSRLMKPVESRNAFEKILDPFDNNNPNTQYLKDNRPHNVDVAAEIKYLRAMCQPSYKDVEGYKTSFPPTIVMLSIPGHRLDDYGAGDVVYAVMTGCDVVYNLAFPDSTPRKAVVSLVFRLVVQDPIEQTIRNVGLNQDPTFDYESSVWNSIEQDPPAPGGARTKNGLDGWVKSSLG